MDMEFYQSSSVYWDDHMTFLKKLLYVITLVNFQMANL